MFAFALKPFPGGFKKLQGGAGDARWQVCAREILPLG